MLVLNILEICQQVHKDSFLEEDWEHDTINIYFLKKTKKCRLMKEIQSFITFAYSILIQIWVNYSAFTSFPWTYVQLTNLWYCQLLSKVGFHIKHISLLLTRFTFLYFVATKLLL
jgi:hypothetical protein